MGLQQDVEPHLEASASSPGRHHLQRDLEASSPLDGEGNVDVGDVVGGRENAEQSVGMFECDIWSVSIVGHLMGAIR